jgi:hypothetical protein
MGVATMFDDPRAAGGGWRAQYDHNDNPATPPIFPDPNFPISWSYDKNYLAPEDAVVGSFAQTFGAPFMPAVDMPLLQVDTPVWNTPSLAFASGAQEYVPATPGLQLGIKQDAPSTVTWNTVIIDARIYEPAVPATFNIIVKQNTVTVLTLPVSLPLGDTHVFIPVTLAVTLGDDIEVFLVSTTGGVLPTYIDKVMATIGRAVPWAVDALLPAGTYRGYRQL